jgi:hypothetical protein
MTTATDYAAMTDARIAALLREWADTIEGFKHYDDDLPEAMAEWLPLLREAADRAERA